MYFVYTQTNLNNFLEALHTNQINNIKMQGQQIFFVLPDNLLPEFSFDEIILLLCSLFFHLFLFYSLLFFKAFRFLNI